jgi:hypothetical protein
MFSGELNMAALAATPNLSLSSPTGNCADLLLCGYFSLLRARLWAKICAKVSGYGRHPVIDGEIDQL